jgi:hypothetical protein
MKRPLLWLAALGLLLVGVVGQGRAGPFQPSSIGPLHVSAFNTYYDQFTGGGGGGTLFTAVSLPAGATALQFSASGSVDTFGSSLFGPDGLDASGNSSLFQFTNYPPSGGTYQGTPVGRTTGIDPSLFGIFFNPNFAGTPANSFDFRANSGIVPDPRTLGSYSPSLNQPFFIGDGLDQNNKLGVTAGNPQTFDIPAGATELLLGIGPDNNLNDNSGPGYDVTVFDNSGSSPPPPPPLPSVPEPGTIALFGIGIAGVAVFCWRRRTRTASACPSKVGEG